MKKGYAFYCFGLQAYWFVAVAFVSLFFPSLSKAQSASDKGLPFISNYSPKTFKALPQVWSIEQSADGMMYFGIQSQIMEYDGIKWRKMTGSGVGPSIVVRSMNKSANNVIYYGAYTDIGYIG